MGQVQISWSGRQKKERRGGFLQESKKNRGRSGRRAANMARVMRLGGEG